MFPNAALSRSEQPDTTALAPWTLDPALLPLLREIVADVAVAGSGARLVMDDAPHGRPRVLASVGGARHSWRALVAAVLERGELLAAGGAVAAPVEAARGVRGALVLYQGHEPLSSTMELLLRAHAARAETAFATSARRLTDTHGAVEALFQSLSAHDPDTARHAAVVRRLAQTLGAAMRLAAHDLLALEWSALLHDIGKIAIAPGVLRKPGPLSALEWTLMRQHPARGERIVRAVPGLGAVALALRHHHERWDGGGYPDRLAGEAIPLHARILALVDAYETMRMGRPHRCPLPRDEALGELRRGAGTHFDPALLTWLPVLAAYDAAPA